jgi:hypothetical protein
VAQTERSAAGCTGCARAANSERGSQHRVLAPAAQARQAPQELQRHVRRKPRHEPSSRCVAHSCLFALRLATRASTAAAVLATERQDALLRLLALRASGRHVESPVVDLPVVDSADVDSAGILLFSRCPQDHSLHRPPSATAPRARCKVRHRTKALLRQQLGDRGDTWYLARLHRACCASALPR